MDGRKTGSNCQHFVHMAHHGPVSRLLVVSAAGRPGLGPIMILAITPTIAAILWKGARLVKSSYQKL